MTNKKIIYIIGAGRSGTTLLDIVLGNNPQVFSAGELNRFPIRQGVPPLLNAGSPKFLFWDKFRMNFLGNYKKYDLAGMQILINKFEYHLGVLRILFASKTNRTMNDYHEYLETFFETLAGEVDEEYIVDSSKYPCRGYHLSELYKENICFVYIKRNPVEVVKSFAKKDIEQPPKSWVMANLYLCCVNILCLFILKKVGRNSKIATITLEDLTNEPEKTLSYISNTLGVDLSHSIELTKNYSPLTTGCLFDGNRLRMKDKIVMEKTALSSGKKYSMKDKITLLFNSPWWH